jgi:retron-type reverse transcriptase
MENVSMSDVPDAQEYGPPKTREELYARIRETSRDSVILEEMLRLGFLKPGEGMPEEQAEEVRRMAELSKELHAVRTELSRLQNEEAIRKAIRKRRMEESRKKRQETKERRERERIERAEAWKIAKAKDIGYLGEGVSAGLGNKEGNESRLKEYGLPVLSAAADVASAMGVSVGELRFLAFSRKVSKVTHYKRFYIPKKRGGERLISAPMPRLKDAQYWVLASILQKVSLHDAAHGFLLGRSIVSNAGPHVGKDIVLNIDLKDFFPTITYRRVKGLFLSLGYSEQVATILGLLCTEPDVDEVELDNVLYYVEKGRRFLPQGAPTSPMVTNIICRRLDKRLKGLAESFGFTYTRYADDLTFSGPKDKSSELGKLLGKINNIVIHEGFTVHREKTRILHRGSQQEVTGVVVNDKPGIDRKTMRRLRAVLFQLEKDGVKNKRWGNCGDVIASVEGYAHFVYMVDAEKGKALLEQVGRIKEKIGYKRPVYRRKAKPKPPKPPKVETRGVESRDGKPWWKFW